MINKLEKVKFNNDETFKIVAIEENKSLQPQTLTIKILLENSAPTNTEYYEQLLEKLENTNKIQIFDSEDELMTVFLNYTNLVSLSKVKNDYIDVIENGEVENNEIRYDTLSLLLTKSSLEEKINTLNKSLEETNEIVDYLLVNTLKEK